MWLAHLLTEGAHRKGAVAVYVQGMHHPLRGLTAHVIQPLDCSDDRLSPLRSHVSKPTYWHQIARALHARSLAVPALPPAVIRCAATTGSGGHEVTAEGLLQCGQRKDEPTRPQSKGMRGALAPVGMPRATEGLAGERAEDGLYLPIIKRIRPGLPQTGLLVGGDGTMSALDPRASLAQHQDLDVSPWPCTGATAEAMETWVTAGVTKDKTGN